MRSVLFAISAAAAISGIFTVLTEPLGLADIVQPAIGGISQPVTKGDRLHLRSIGDTSGGYCAGSQTQHTRSSEQRIVIGALAD